MFGLITEQQHIVTDSLLQEGCWSASLQTFTVKNPSQTLRSQVYLCVCVCVCASASSCCTRMWRTWSEYRQVSCVSWPWINSLQSLLMQRERQHPSWSCCTPTMRESVRLSLLFCSRGNALLTADSAQYVLCFAKIFQTNVCLYLLRADETLTDGLPFSEIHCHKKQNVKKFNGDKSWSIFKTKVYSTICAFGNAVLQIHDSNILSLSLLPAHEKKKNDA